LNCDLHNITKFQNTKRSQCYHRDYGVNGITNNDIRLTAYRNHHKILYIIGDIPATLKSEDGVTHSKIEQVIVLE